jgi:hypothetical protein
MRRKINVLHLNDSGAGHTHVFEWETKKKGLTNEVVCYLIDKFMIPSEHPAKYTARSLKQGDRIELVLLEGTLAGTSTTFELVSSTSFRQL